MDLHFTVRLLIIGVALISVLATMLDHWRNSLEASHEHLTLPPTSRNVRV